MLACRRHRALAAPEPVQTGGPLVDRLGAPAYHRVWCAATELPANQLRRIEFCGWLIGWSDCTAEPRGVTRPEPIRRIEVRVFMTTDRKIVLAIDVVGDLVERSCNQPDSWATLLAVHDTLEGTHRWAATVADALASTAGWRAVVDALEQGEATVAELPAAISAG